MRDSLSIGSAPANEDCAQVGDNDYQKRARAELQAFKNLIRRTVGIEPEGASLRVKANKHDFGTYYDLECEFDDRHPEAVTYCFEVERKTPSDWDDVAKRELREFLER